MSGSFREFRDVELAACYGCGARWFGAAGEEAAARHAAETGHNVVVSVRVRQTWNGLPGDHQAPAAKIEPCQPAPTRTPIPATVPQRPAPRGLGGRVAYAGRSYGEAGQHEKRYGGAD